MNILYEIINKETNQMLFNYVVIFIIFIFIFNNVNFNMTILVGLLFATIIVYYWHSYRKINNLSEEKIQDEKFYSVNPDTNILKKYPDMIDSLFYIEDFKKYNIPNYEKIVNLFQNFAELYDACIINNNFIDNYYNSLNNIKYNIINDIEKYNYVTSGSTLSNKLDNAQNNIEIMLNKYIDNLIKLQKQNIEQNGYTNYTKVLDTTNILPYNFSETNNNVLY
jgi:hypothetical protein